MDFYSLLRWENALCKQPNVDTCCRDLGNSTVVDEQEFTAIRKCSVCGKKHHWMRAEAGNLYSRG